MSFEDIQNDAVQAILPDPMYLARVTFPFCPQRTVSDYSISGIFLKESDSDTEMLELCKILGAGG